jgi:hypothetical protein
MTIIQQCENCGKEGNKNIYCTNCIKSADYFDIYRYENEYDRFSRGTIIGRIKAYTWHDAIEYTKSNYFHNQSKNFNINCEKDFAYVEENTESTAMENNGKENRLGYKLYLNKERDKSESSSIKDENLWDLTVATSNNNKNFAAVLNASNKEQQTIAAAIEPNPRNQLIPNAPTMITRSTKEQGQEENTLSNNMVKTND